MLTSDLVRVRHDRKSGELRIVPAFSDGKQRARALELAELVLSLVRDHVGRTREELEEALCDLQCAPRERLLLCGLRKLVDDRCQFDVEEVGAAPDELRAEVFLRAAAARREGAFDREAVLAAVSAARGIEGEALCRGLYADLRAAHLLSSVEPLLPQALIDGYDQAQAQAVLLRAVRVRVDVECARPADYRALFRKLKFLRLLYSISESEEGEGYRIEIDGPFSLFDSVTKYGLQLAMALPAIALCRRWDLRADVRWGKERTALLFRLSGEGGAGPQKDAPLPDEVAALMKGFRALESSWTVRVAPAVLDLPGASVCVPDLLFERKDNGSKGGQKVYLEVLGFWSRAAVWRRVELIERGLRQPILFCVSKRLRVSEDALPDTVPSGLYVYKGVISPKEVLSRLEALSNRVE